MERNGNPILLILMLEAWVGESPDEVLGGSKTVRRN